MVEKEYGVKCRHRHIRHVTKTNTFVTRLGRVGQRHICPPTGVLMFMSTTLKLLFWVASTYVEYIVDILDRHVSRVRWATSWAVVLGGGESIPSSQVAW